MNLLTRPGSWFHAFLPNARRVVVVGTLPVIAAITLSLYIAPVVHASLNWDAEAGTQWWFNPVNWDTNSNSNTALPPSNGQSPPNATDTQINIGSGAWDQGEGVVYDPSNNDPNFANAGSYDYPAGGFGPQVIGPMYISRNTTNTNVLTIKGNLTVGLNANSTGFQVGRSGSTTTQQNLGEVVQLAGTVSVPTTNLDIGQREAPTVDNPANWGNGIYDYRGGTLDVFNNISSHGIRLSAGSSGNGTGGTGRLIMHNPATGGYVRTYDFTVASDRTNGDGVQTGVGIVEFDFENGGTRPIQVAHNLSINNGQDNAGPGIRSTLDLVLHDAPTVDGNGVPQNLGLFDVNYSGFFGGRSPAPAISTATASITTTASFPMLMRQIRWTRAQLIIRIRSSPPYVMACNMIGRSATPAISSGPTRVIVSCNRFLEQAGQTSS